MAMLIIWAGVMVPLASLLLLGGAYMVRTGRHPRPHALWRPLRRTGQHADLRLLGWHHVALGTGWLILGTAIVAGDRLPWPLAATLGVVVLGLFGAGIVLGRRATTAR